MASSNKEFTHYNCQHVFPGSVTTRGLVCSGPFPTAADDETDQPPKTGEIRAADDKLVRWTGTAWVESALVTWT